MTVSVKLVIPNLTTINFVRLPVIISGIISRSRTKLISRKTKDPPIKEQLFSGSRILLSYKKNNWDEFKFLKRKMNKKKSLL